MKTKLIAVVLFGLVETAPLASAQKTSLELNKPYYCSNGLAVTVTKCALRNGKEFCEFKVEQNGKVSFQGLQTGENLAAGLKSCSMTPPPKGATAGAPVPVAAKTIQPPNGKPFSPPYLNGMPSVDFVKSQIQGKDATDTLARQVAVFNELPTVITRFQLADRKRYDATPDEVKITGIYQLAAYELEQGYKKTHTAAEAQEFLRLHGRYELDSALDREMHVKLFSSAFLLELGGADKARNQWYQAHIEEEKRQSEQARAQAAGTQGGGSPFIRNDPGTLAARRCVELGGSELECIGKGLWGGMMDMAGLPADTTISAVSGGPSMSGVVMNGQYNGSSGVWINFGQKSVTVNGCGKLVPESLSYTLTKKESQVLLNVKNEPSPFVFSMENDKKLVGPGPIDIKGQIIVGYNDVFMQEYINGVPQAGGNCAGRCGYWVHDPVYGPKTERCTIGSFVQAPPGPPDKSPLINSLETAMTSLMHAGPAGLRMAGKYTNAGGLMLEFEDDGVTIDCGAAHVKQAYVVDNGASQIRVTVKNGAMPFTLAVQQNGTLTGSGNADISGRVVTGATDTAITYASKTARCAIGTLTAK